MLTFRQTRDVSPHHNPQPLLKNSLYDSHKHYVDDNIQIEKRTSAIMADDRRNTLKFVIKQVYQH